MGYSRAGFDVVGVDIEPQPRYPFPFILGDAIDVMMRLLAGERFLASDGNWYGLDDFDAFAASPPCQFASEQTPMKHRNNHPNLIPATRALLVSSGKPYVIENVENARKHLNSPVMICGSMLGLPLWRHRYFECGLFWSMSPGSCDHTRRPVTFTSGSHSRKLNRKSPVLLSGTTPRSAAEGGRFKWTVQDCRAAAEIPWMTREEIDEAIPPAYTEFIGGKLMEALR